MNNIESGWSDHLLGHLLVTMVTLLVNGLYGMDRTPAPYDPGSFHICRRLAFSDVFIPTVYNLYSITVKRLYGACVRSEGIRKAPDHTGSGFNHSIQSGVSAVSNMPPSGLFLPVGTWVYSII